MLEEQNRPDKKAIKAYFDQWSIYDVIIKNDYMAHSGIYNSLREALVSRGDDPFSLVDLGCGDASQIAATLRGLPIRNYVGIDLSPVALDYARKNMAGITDNASFIESDFSEYLKSQQTKEVDVIVAGFTVHHLGASDKAKLFFAAANKLLEGGMLLYYDVFRRDEESREEYIDAYTENVDMTWTALSPEDREKTKDHLRCFDFPETQEALSSMARDAGFTTHSVPLFQDENRFHRLYSFTC
jgi:SAM-dependent methyltransferase